MRRAFVVVVIFTLTLLAGATVGRDSTLFSFRDANAGPGSRQPSCQSVG